MTKVKICGITNLEDALLSAKFGADALGFNFYEKSPRYIVPEKAREIIEQLLQEILKVGVFVNEDLDKIIEIASIAKLDALQLHGEETPEFARELKQKTNLEIIKAFRVSPGFKPEDVLPYETDAILLDAYSPKEHGGTGETFDWEIAKKVQEIFPKMYLAGGLSHENIFNAIRFCEPYAVDACSCLEIEKGKKSKIELINYLSIAKNVKNYDVRRDNIYDILFLFQAKPYRFFEKKSLTLLDTFLFGFRVAIDVSNSHFDFKEFYSPLFTNWVNEKLSTNNSNYSDYKEVILDKYNGDEKKAFDHFFALLEEFKLEKEDLSNE